MQVFKKVLLFIWNLPVSIESHMPTDRTLARILFILNIPFISIVPLKCANGVHVTTSELVMWSIILLYQCHWYKCLDMPWQNKKRRDT